MSSGDEPLNILIPMGGVGRRFSEQSFRFPKPLINIVGRPLIMWLIDNLTIKPTDTLYLAIDETVEHDHSIELRMMKEYPDIQLRVVRLSFKTRGAAETLLVALNSMDAEHLDRRTICLDCDTFYFDDILGKFRSTPRDVGASFFFVDQGSDPIFSYLQVDSDNKILGIREKVAISKLANTGAYAFSSARSLRAACETTCDGAVGAAGEYYTSTVISLLIEQQATFLALQVSDFHCCGTPKQLEEFLVKVRRGLVKCKPIRFCFDLDNTLVTYPTVKGDYSSVLARPSNVELVRELRAAGHYIIIQTNRGMKLHAHNVGSVVADIGRVTLDTLHRLNIPYDEIYFGKPYADVYVDDLGVNGLVDTRQEIGWPPAQPRAETPQFDTRFFNEVTVKNGLIVKRAPVEMLDGEIYFHQHVPESLRHFFPAMVDHSASEGVASLRRDFVQGVTLAALHVGCALTPARLLRLCDALHLLHEHAGEDSGDSTAVSREALYSNYAAKLRARLESGAAVYAELQEGAPEFAAAVCREVDKYEGAHCVNVIHGDPVLSNALLTAGGEIKFIDMRGKLGTQLSCKGDSNYDWAKVLQSLCGYDHVISGRPVPSEEELEPLRSAFFGFLKDNVPSASQKMLYLLTSSLLVSLIPLHKNNHVAFLNLAKKTFERYNASK